MDVTNQVIFRSLSPVGSKPPALQLYLARYLSSMMGVPVLAENVVFRKMQRHKGWSPKSSGEQIYPAGLQCNLSDIDAQSWRLIKPPPRHRGDPRCLIRRRFAPLLKIIPRIVSGLLEDYWVPLLLRVDLSPQVDRSEGIAVAGPPGAGSVALASGSARVEAA
jgi:hypothetical protein